MLLDLEFNVKKTSRNFYDKSFMYEELNGLFNFFL